MARKFGSVNVEMWNDPEFRALPPAAQHLYLMLWTAPDLSFCGVHDWRPGRLTKLSRGFTEEHTRVVADCLVAHHFLVIDKETEEVLVRSWVRFDELLKQPRLAVSYAHAYAATYSETLRAVMVHELKKMREMWPTLTCWSDDRVASLLTHPAVSAKDLPTVADPFGDGFGDGLALGLPQSQGKVWASVSAPPTPAPTPTPTTNTGNAAATYVASDFDVWWADWPRKVDKGHALKAYKAARKKATADAILAGLRVQLPALRETNPKFLPLPATWLNGERWGDERPDDSPRTDADGRLILPPLPSRSPWGDA